VFVFPVCVSCVCLCLRVCVCVCVAGWLAGARGVSSLLGIRAPEGQSSLIFASVFVITWCGAAVVTVNAQLLGGTLSFFQSVCVLGTCTSRADRMGRRVVTARCVCACVCCASCVLPHFVFVSFLSVSCACLP